VPSKLTPRAIKVKLLKVKIKGKAPLLMHSDLYSNPLHPLTKRHKELTAKRKKTDSDHEAIALSEWRGGLYWDDSIGLHIPGENIDACILAAAKLQRLGSHYKRAAFVMDDNCPLKIDDKIGGDIDKLVSLYDKYSFAKSVVVSRARIMRVRPMFKNWETDFQLAFNPEMIDSGELIKAVNDAGNFIGLCDWRPRFGRFSADIDVMDMK